MRRKTFSLCLVLGLVVLSPLAFSQEPGDTYMWEFNEGEGNTVTK